MIIEMLRDWWLRWLDWCSGRSTASRRLHALRLRQTTTARQRRLDNNRGRHWRSEATSLLPTLRPLMTYGQQLGYRLPPFTSPTSR
ncbi:hypothetical protein O7623_19325 [Solwaraspora sp. WMMD791]|uniref:hypothetical protein n=1 Tax=Solwaraspora sp. WMMD791 TaxID=3016086 RepID=UPI00249BDE3A|nr:hypothetical protein [Solwaraspora sp. WMMD791]WFE25534.1 hypothetical protein O7623_19325 [Solwaraspora sp. WMMD791]